MQQSEEVKQIISKARDQNYKCKDDSVEGVFRHSAVKNCFAIVFMGNYSVIVVDDNYPLEILGKWETMWWSNDKFNL